MPLLGRWMTVCQEDEIAPGKRSWMTLATPAAAPHHQGLPGDVQQAGAGGSHQPSAAALDEGLPLSLYVLGFNLASF